MKWDMALAWKSFLFYSIVLGEFSFAKTYKIHSLTYSSIVIETPSKAKFHDTFWNPSTSAACYCIELLSSFVDPCQEIYHAFKTKITYTPQNICTTPILGVGARHTFHLGSTKKNVLLLHREWTKIYWLGSFKINAPNMYDLSLWKVL